MRHALERSTAGFLIAASFTLVAVTAWAIDATPGYLTIQRAFLREDFTTVASMAQTFLVQNPDVPEVPRVWIWLALSLDRLQRTNEALRELDRLKGRLASDDPVWPEVLYWEGDVSRRALQLVRAKLAYQRLITRYPTSMWTSQAQMGLGLTYLHQQAFDLAIGYFHEVALRQADTPAGPEALLFEGLCQLRLEHFQAAANLLTPLVDRLHDPNIIAQAAFYLGESLTGLSRFDEAGRAYQRAIAVDGSSAWSRLASFGLGWVDYRAGRCDESLSAFDQYLAKTPAELATPALPTAATNSSNHRIEAFFAQVSCFLQGGRDAEALARFERMVSSDPAHPLTVDSGLAVAEAYRRHGRLAESKELLHALLRAPVTQTARAKIQLRLGALALDQGNTAQATTVYELANEVDVPAIRQAALNGLGDVQLFLGHLDEATQDYAQAGALSANDSLAAYALYQLGRIQLQRGAIDEAIGLFQRVAGSTDVGLADDAKLALALAYLNQHEDGLARSLLETIRRQRPHSVLAARAAYYVALMSIGHEEDASVQTLCEETLAGAATSGEALEARLLLAELLAERSSVREAMAWLNDAYRSLPLPAGHRAKLAKRLGDFARSQRAYRDAIRWYETAAERLPSFSAETAYWIASCYEEAGDLELAMRWYQASESAPWRVRGQLALARLLEREDRAPEAEAIYERLAAEPIPEAKAIRERLMALRGEATDKE